MERSDGSRGPADLGVVLAGFLPGEGVAGLAALLGVTGFFICLLDCPVVVCSSRASPLAGLRRRRRRRLAVPSLVVAADDAAEVPA